MSESIPDIPEIFGEALEIESAEERGEFLDQVCRGDARRRAEVERLLSAYAAAGSFLESPAVDVARGFAATASDLPLDPPELFIPRGTTMGRYKLLEPIGEGGYGVVFMAEQTSPVQRKVALKIIKAGMDTRQVIARFEAERQTLALMDHPNIAKVFDAGATDTGRPYFVMELVQGVSIIKYCDQHHLTPRQRLELFVQVCQGVQHAHTKGIIHRDLKPSNVLVTVYDGKAVPKVIDFGVAKATGQQLTDRTMFTGFGDVIGTLEYMSPEQAEVNQLDVDTRSDIYSLGVLLYELLAGSTPLESKQTRQTALLEALRCIREDEPPAPSTRISMSEALPSIAANRGLEPKKLIGSVKGELDWIVMRALEKDRNRRYDSANAFAADIQRYLHDEPVEASPPSTWYRFGKLARRNKAVLATAMVVALAVVLAVGSLAISYLRINRSLAQEKQAKADLVQTLYYQWVSAAAHERTKNRQARAEELLQRCPSDLRGWEWHYLKRLPFAGVMKLAHDDIITRLAWSPDGKLLASAGRNGGVKVWDAQNGTMVFQPPAQKGFVRGLAFSPDGARLAAGGEDGTINLSDVRTHQLLRRIPTGVTATIVQALDFSPDGGYLAAATKDKKVRLWKLPSGGEEPLADDLLATGGLAFAPDGRLVTVSANGVVKTIDVSAGRTLEFPAHTGAAVWVATFSRDRRLVALGCEDGAVKIIRIDPFQEVQTLQAHTGEISNLAFGALDQRLASTGNDLSVRVWDLRQGQVALALDISERRTNGLAFSPDGQRLAVGSADGVMQILDGTPLNGAGDAGELLTLEGHTDAVTSLAYSPDGTRIASASRDGTAKVWDANLGTAVLTFRGHRAALTAVAWTANGQRIASASWDGTARVWDAATGAEVLAALDAGAGPVYGLMFNRDGTALATAHHDGSVRMWDAATGQPINCIAHAHSMAVFGVTFSPDGQHLASAGGGDNTVKIWDWRANTKDPVRTLRAPDNIIRSPAYSRDGQRLVAVVATPARVWTWDTRTGEGTFRPLPNSWNTSQAVFTPRGRLAVVSGGRIQFFESDGSDGRTLVGCHAGEIECATFSPDGRRLATGAGFKGRGEIRIWDASRFENPGAHSTRRDPTTRPVEK